MRITRIYAAAALLFAIGATAQLPPGGDPDQVLARVGDEVITAGEFVREMEFRIQELQMRTGQNLEPDRRLRQALMSEMINGRILSVAARNAGVEVTDEELEAEFEQRKASFASEADYEAYLRRLGISEAELKKNIRSRLRVTRFVDRKAGDLTPSDAEIEEAYETLKERGDLTRTEKTRDIAAILIAPDGESDEAWRAAEKRAGDVHDRLEAGEDFQELAREVSDEPQTAAGGGVLKEMEFGSFYPELEAAMDELAPGAYSRPVRSVKGWYLVTILKINEPGTMPLERVREMIARELVEQKRKAVINDIVEEARKLMRIELVEAPEAAGGQTGGE